MKQLDNKTHSTIISFLDEGLSARTIASRVKVSHSAVNRIRAVHSKAIQKPKGGKKPRLSATDKKHIMHIYRTGDAETAQQIANQL